MRGLPCDLSNTVNASLLELQVSVVLGVVHALEDSLEEHGGVFVRATLPTVLDTIVEEADGGKPRKGRSERRAGQPKNRQNI